MFSLLCLELQCWYYDGIDALGLGNQIICYLNFSYENVLFFIICVSVASELLILSLDLVKNRVGVMSPEMRKGFIGSILVGLIEKSSDSKIMKAITKMVEDWVRVKVRLTHSKSY